MCGGLGTVPIHGASEQIREEGKAYILAAIPPEFSQLVVYKKLTARVEYGQ
jgi:hypothetical protein